MLLPIRPICNPKKIRRDGTSLIQIQYCYSAEKKTLLNTGIAIPPGCWNRKKLRVNANLPQAFGIVQEINIEIQRQQRLVEDIVTFAIQKEVKDPLKFVKTKYKPTLKISALDENFDEKERDVPVVNFDVFYQINDYINFKAKSVTPNMVNVYNNMRDTLKAFEVFRQRKITFESFDFAFYEEFVDYMMYDHVQRRRRMIIKGFKISTIGKTIKHLRVFLANRIRRKIIAPINLEDFKIMDEEADAVYLTEEEIFRIYKTNLAAHPQLEECRDLFVFGCLTGLRFSDFTTLEKEDFRNGMLYKKQRKSDHWVVIPLRDIADEIFQNRFKKVIPKFENAAFNKLIKEIVRFAGIIQTIKFSHKKGNKDVIQVRPKCDWVTSHTCRRSFCTNEFLAGTPVDLIMKISGHRSLRDFYKYIRITPEEAGQKIKEIWTQRGMLTHNTRI
ncbi:MAG: phage integrase SAM-like domain-containing protein [Sphingobacteriales bacterium]|nr:phage integrase SAM-like domain-containing protein [Sphingobacteriales bacterium]OJV98490.1 MAG: integrase [Sphingobacteriales bacterium 44-61]